MPDPAETEYRLTSWGVDDRPGQAVTFTVYEYLKDKLEKSTIPFTGGTYEE